MLAKYGLPIRKMFAEKNRLFSLPSTGKSLSEELILASTNPQYDGRLFIELQVQYIKIARTEQVVYTNWFFVFVSTFRTIYAHNMFSPCSELVVFMY